VFTLPLLRLIQNLAFLLLIAALVILGVLYVTSGGLEIAENRIRFRPGPMRHVAANAALLFLVLAWGYRLDLYELLFSRRGVVYGASYTDVHAQVLGYRVLVALSLAGFGVTVYDVVRGRYGLTLTAFGALIIGMIAFKGLYPGAVQQFEVEPNEINKEAPYIARNIAYTRHAFDLASIGGAAGRERESGGQALPGRPDRQRRLWDWRPLLAPQPARRSGCAIFRTWTWTAMTRTVCGDALADGRSRNCRHQTWQNQHLIFTHGYGLVMSPVNEVTPEGLPKFYLADIPPAMHDTLASRLAVSRPEIYFGERTSDYALAATREQEFDYPQGDKNIYASYGGDGGLAIDSW
jgi:uncharacterized membrane protein (UPF0182 family)